MYHCISLVSSIVIGISQCGKLKNFSGNQILREIKFGNFGVPKTAILTFLAAQNLGIFNASNVKKSLFLDNSILLFAYYTNCNPEESQRIFHY